MTNYFETVFTQEPFLDDGLDQSTKSQNRLLTVNFDWDDILKALSALDTSKSAISDELQPKIVKNAIVELIHKTESGKHSSNYRSVILISVSKRSQRHS